MNKIKEIIGYKLLKTIKKGEMNDILPSNRCEARVGNKRV